MQYNSNILRHSCLPVFDWRRIVLIFSTWNNCCKFLTSDGVILQISHKLFSKTQVLWCFSLVYNLIKFITFFTLLICKLLTHNFDLCVYVHSSSSKFFLNASKMMHIIQVYCRMFLRCLLRINGFYTGKHTRFRIHCLLWKECFKNVHFNIVYMECW